MKHEKSIFTSLPNREKKRWKELAVWVLFWTDSMMTLSGISLSSPAWPYIAGLTILLTTLLIVTMVSLVESIKNKELKPLINLIKEPGEKKKWLIFGIFFFLFLSTICFSRFVYDKPLLAKIFLTGLGGFSAILLTEWLAKPSQQDQ